MAPLENDHLRVCILQCAQLERDLVASNDLAWIGQEAKGLLETFVSMLNTAMSASAAYHTLEPDTKQTVLNIWKDCASILEIVEEMCWWYSLQFRAHLQLDDQHKCLILRRCIQPDRFMNNLSDLNVWLGWILEVMKNGEGEDDEMAQWYVQIRDSINQIRDKVDATRELAHILSPVGRFRQTLDAPTSSTILAARTAETPAKDAHDDGDATKDLSRRSLVQNEINTVLANASDDTMDQVYSRVWEIAQYPKVDDYESSLRLIIETLFKQACASSQHAPMYAMIYKCGLLDNAVHYTANVDRALMCMILETCQETSGLGGASEMSVDQQLGMAYFMGHLFSIGAVQEWCIHVCIRDALWDNPPSIFKVTILYQLVWGFGNCLDDTEEGKGLMDTHFEMIADLRLDHMLPVAKAMLEDLVELRRGKWKQNTAQCTTRAQVLLAEAKEQIIAARERQVAKVVSQNSG